MNTAGEARRVDDAYTVTGVCKATRFEENVGGVEREAFTEVEEGEEDIAVGVTEEEEGEGDIIVGITEEEEGKGDITVVIAFENTERSEEAA